MITTADLCLRLASAVLVGGLIGVNREARAKPVGVRTLGLVGLGSALVTLSGSSFSATSHARPRPHLPLPAQAMP